MNRTSKRRAWTTAHVRELKLLARKKTPAKKIAKTLKRTVRSIAARREVLLACGTFNSPQLLQLSGVGPAQHLTDLGIPVVRDLPGVGSNLQDHFNTYCTYRISKNLSLNALQYSLSHRLIAGAQYVFFRSAQMEAMEKGTPPRRQSGWATSSAARTRSSTSRPRPGTSSRPAS